MTENVSLRIKMEILSRRLCRIERREMQHRFLQLFHHISIISLVVVIANGKMLHVHDI